MAKPRRRAARGVPADVRMRLLFVGVRRWRFVYPSGRCGTVTGTLYQGDETLDSAPVVADAGTQTLVALDPRAIIEDHDGAAAYHPRQMPATRMAAWVTLWLAEHPEWDRVAAGLVPDRRGAP